MATDELEDGRLSCGSGVGVRIYLGMAGTYVVMRRHKQIQDNLAEEGEEIESATVQDPRIQAAIHRGFTQVCMCASHVFFAFAVTSLCSMDWQAPSSCHLSSALFLAFLVLRWIPLVNLEGWTLDADIVWHGVHLSQPTIELLCNQLGVAHSMLEHRLTCVHLSVPPPYSCSSLLKEMPFF